MIDFKQIKRLFYFILVVICAIKILFDIYEDWCYNYQFESFGLSDWLINYQGGFVRRGLIGEILYQLYNVHPYPMKAVIRCIALLTFVPFFGLLFNIFMNEKWSLLTVLFPLTLVGGDLVNYRRDFLMFIVLYVIYYLFFVYYYHKRDFLRWLLLQFVSVLSILIYEPSFFLFVPILCLVVFMNEDGSWQKRLMTTICIWGSSILTMILVCLWKGQTNQAEIIWRSWEPMFLTYQNGEDLVSHIGAGVRFLGNDMLSTFQYHLSVLFYLDDWPSVSAILSNFLYIAAFVLVYIIVTHTPHVSRDGIKENEDVERVSLSNILLIQLASMIPMFTVLSCDLGRTIPSCIYTTFFIAHLSNMHHVTIFKNGVVAIISNKIQSVLGAIRGLDSFYVYVSLIVCVPMTAYFGPKIEDTLLYQVFEFISLIK